MVQLGYRAKDVFENLWCFQWGEDDTFQILKDGVYVNADHTEFEVLEIFHSVG
tara:strand:- start:5603 stop:5761 length:159 start_codon:yes stop_codon:yes gene_type:complete